MTKVHKVFVSFYNEDLRYKDHFVRLMSSHMVDMSVHTGDINPNNNTDTIRRIIRDEYIGDATVTVVLIGTDTWRRKHVDWEIGSSIRDTKKNPRTGLLGILLPTYPLVNGEYNEHTIPPRLWYNVVCEFAKIYTWSQDPNANQNIIHDAYKKRDKINPDNSYPPFANNRSFDSPGWR